MPLRAVQKSKMAILKKFVNQPMAPETYNSTTAARDALRLAKGRGITTQPLDVEGLASSIGIKVFKEALSPDISGYLKRQGGAWIIGVNSLHHPRRQRFTIAHELGHFFLHRNLGEFEDRALFRKENQRSGREYEANDFAARLLMPEHELRLSMERNNGDVAEIAKVFGVSELATRFRIDNVTSQLEID